MEDRRALQLAKAQLRAKGNNKWLCVVPTIDGRARIYNRLSALVAAAVSGEAGRLNTHTRCRQYGGDQMYRRSKRINEAVCGRAGGGARGRHLRLPS